ALGSARGHGILITAVEPDSPADQAGLERGLVIYRLGESEVNSVKEVEDLLRRARSGTSVELAVGVIRSGGQVQRVQTVTLAARRLGKKMETRKPVKLLQEVSQK